MFRRDLLMNLGSTFPAFLLFGALRSRAANKYSPQTDRTSTISSSSSLHAHERYMRRAIQLARNVPKVPFAAILVDEKGVVVAEGMNRARVNPTWHGEMDAINKYARARRRVDWSNLTLYTTAEPCAMCQGAVAWTGIRSVVYGSSIPFLQSLSWSAIDIRAEEVARRANFRQCKIVGGVLAEECNELFRAALLLK